MSKYANSLTTCESSSNGKKIKARKTSFILKKKFVEEVSSETEEGIIGKHVKI